LKDSWSEAVALAMKAKYGNGWEREFQSYVSPSRILEWEEERKRLDEKIESLRIELREVGSRNIAAELALSAALQRTEKLEGALKQCVDVMPRIGRSPVRNLDEIISYAAALLTEAPQQGGSK
jgi:hypothetical protein